jgi:DNA polymerase I-like protein with 3'-5' exonuclease and polymerase domains
MNIITIDFETFYDRSFSLSKMTTEEYIRDELFEVIGVGVKVGDGETQWFSGPHRDTKKWLEQFPWDTSIAIAHNAMFDMAILNWHFDIRPKMIADTLSMLRAIDGPDAGNSLAKAAERYGLGKKGDEVINALGKGRLDFTPEELGRYGQYCINDVELTYELFRQIAPLVPKLEARLIDQTIRMFSEPVLTLDKEILEEHLTAVREKKDKLMTAVEADKSVLMSNPKLAELLQQMKVVPPTKVSPTTGKTTWAFGKNDEGFKALLDHPNPKVQAVVAARMGVKSTLEETRTERFIGIAGRGTLPVPLRYYAAHTGRWGGDDKVNLQNLPRKSALKKAIRAPEGYMFIDCDSSQIEARTLAWLAGQDDLVAAFDAGEDVYKIMASSIYNVPIEEVTDDQRFVGKTTILGCFGPDTMVLTNNGWKRIVEVQATDTLWDGEEWVTHEGVVPQGEKDTLTARGLTATLDHEILTGHGWQEWSEVATNPSLFQSAIDRANWKSFGGSSTANLQDVRLGGTPLSAALVGGKGGWTATISRLDVQPGVTGAQKAQPQQRARSTGATKLSCLTSNIANAFSTVSLAVLDVATTLRLKPTLTTEVGVSSYTKHGALTEARSSATSCRLTVGKTPSVTSTASTILGAMSRAISASLHAAKTLVTSERPAPCRQRLMTYDIAYAGPRNRYTVATDAGPIIVHNCGYGMGAAKFQMQLKTFGVELPLGECKRIINVYRATYPMIPGLWGSAGRALFALRTQRTSQLGREGVLQVDLLGIKLPNGMYIRYPNLREDNEGQLVYDTKRGRSTLATRIYGGKVVENICQALARIVIGEQLLMVARRYRVVMTVHDAVGCIAPVEVANEARNFVEQCMRMRPKWAPGLPLNCESKIGESYGG